MALLPWRPGGAVAGVCVERKPSRVAACGCVRRALALDYTSVFWWSARASMVTGLLRPSVNASPPDPTIIPPSLGLGAQEGEGGGGSYVTQSG